MTPWRSSLGILGVLLAAVVAQTTVFGRPNAAGIAPDVVMLVVILLPLRLRSETTLLISFTTGLAVDALGSTALGLRALTLTVVAYVAIKTKERADYSPLAAAVWIGLLTLVGSVLLLTVGTLVSELPLTGGQALRRIVMTPLFTFVVALIAWPVLARLIEPARRSL
ncbi:MAG: rod shape-determining protein MreD [Acidimicrobiia bacterium]|nr:rod shape-determining protein MreD [Acidimicrobiia bacterium]MDH4309249.1 rod shape-determining protein MreD [Acidimicrobiia bacterium]MDH5293918.1 rod shape-determining protein MreD [Acidimicrobiia bacterium]